jgi:diaminopimelate decarboxylase
MAWVASGRGVEVVSESELSLLLECGVPVDRLLVNGVAKHRWLPSHPVRRLRVHFDSLLELDTMLPMAVTCAWRVGVRCHVPDEADARDPRYGGQFGMSTDEAIVALRRLRGAGLAVDSLHFHLGQSPQTAGTYRRSVDHLKAICAAADVEPPFIDCGGGLPAASDPRCPSAIAGLRAAVEQITALFPGVRAVWLENGRHITSDSTVLAVRVLDIKERDECRYLLCDGGRTNQALAADVQPHLVLPIADRGGYSRPTTICGPTCMTDDRLGRFDLSEQIAAGDVLVWMEAGAYHLPWETRFSHGLCAVAWFGADGQLVIARERERTAPLASEWTTMAQTPYA